MNTNNSKQNHHPIDAVITWVNGNDPEHKKKLDEYLLSIGTKPKSANSTRFTENGELKYCITSLLRFAPWIRKIFIITDNQTPGFIPLIQNSKYKDKVTVIDHKTVFKGYENVLPTFNSRSIESVLWRIPDIADQYIYLNDDFVLLQPVAKETFFHQSKMVLRGKWETQQSKRIITPVIDFIKNINKDDNPRVKSRMAQAYSAKILGYEQKYLRVAHNPHPQIRSLQAEFYSKNPSILEKNISYKLRSKEQFLPVSLTSHLAIQKNLVILDNKYSTLRLKLNKLSLFSLKILLLKSKISKKILFGCLQSMDMAKPSVRKTTINWLDKRVGTLESFLISQ